MRGRLHMAGTFVALAMVAGCAGDRPELLNLRYTGTGPDEFAVLPGKPLQTPPSYGDLPAPTPGAANRTDPTPEADAVAALGGNPGLTTGGGVRDPALVNRVGRFGAQGGIRQQLAAEDLAFRRQNDGRVLERIFNVNVYYKAYRRQSLDQYRELERLRAAGVRTPAAPPEELLR